MPGGLPGLLAATAELVRAVGGALLAFFSVLALLVLTWTSLGDIAETARGEAFVAVVGAISTIVGGYVGLKVGASGKDDAVQGQKHAEAAKEHAEAAKDKAKDDVAAAKNDVAVLMGKLPPPVAGEARAEVGL